MKQEITIKQLNRIIKRINKAIFLQGIITKEGEPNKMIENLKAQRKAIIQAFKAKCDPKNKVRDSRPKKIQRKLGILPAI